MSAATSIAVKVRPEILQQWKQEARDGYEKQFRFKWNNDVSGKCIRNPLRQQMNDTVGYPEVKSIIQGEFYGKEDYFPPKKSNNIDFVKKNKDKFKKFKIKKVSDKVVHTRSPLKPSNKQPNISTTMYEEPMLLNHRRKLDLSNQRKRTPDTVANSMFHPLSMASNAKNINNNNNNVEFANLAEELPQENEGPNAPKQSLDTRPKASHGKLRPHIEALQDVASSRSFTPVHSNNEEAIHGSNNNTNFSQYTPSKAASVDLHDIQLHENENAPSTRSSKLTDHSLAAVGAAVRNVKMLKSNGPTIIKPPPPPQVPPQQPPNIRSSHQSHVVFSKFHNEGNVLVASHSERAPPCYGPSPCVDQRSPVYWKSPAN